MLRGKENRFPATGGLHRNGDYRGKYYSFGRNICSHCRPRRVHRQIRLSGGRRFWTPLRGATNLVHLSSRNVGRMELRETRAVVAAPPCTTPTWTVSDHPQHFFRATAVYMQVTRCYSARIKVARSRSGAWISRFMPRTPPVNPSTREWIHPWQTRLAAVERDREIPPRPQTTGVEA